MDLDQDLFRVYKTVKMYSLYKIQDHWAINKTNQNRSRPIKTTHKTGTPDPGIQEARTQGHLGHNIPRGLEFSRNVMP